MPAFNIVISSRARLLLGLIFLSLGIEAVMSCAGAGPLSESIANPLSSSAKNVTEGVKPKVSYWHLWTDTKGVSRQARCTMTKFEMKGIGAGVSPQWQGEKTHDGATIFVTELPVGWTGDWHENPKPQWIIPLSGRWFVESMDGQRVEMGPGEVSFGGDQNSQETQGRKGHRSGAVGDEPAVLMIVQLDVPPQAATPCVFH